MRLAEYILTKATLTIGTLRPNRGVPLEIRNMTVPVKESYFFRKSNVLLVKTVDKKTTGLKTIYFIDTANCARTKEVTHRIKGGRTETFQKSMTSITYSKGMGGVDNRDSAIHPYKLERKSFRWFKKIGVHFLQILSFNSWIVYSKCGGTKDYLLFLNELIHLSLIHI